MRAMRRLICVWGLLCVVGGLSTTSWGCAWNDVEPSQGISGDQVEQPPKEVSVATAEPPSTGGASPRVAAATLGPSEAAVKEQPVIDKIGERTLARSQTPVTADNRGGGTTRVIAAPGAATGCIASDGKPPTFPGAAHFPIRDYGRQGEVHSREGLVIYEGMTLSICEESDNDGNNFTLTFDTSHPPVPAEMRLQLLVRKGQGDWHTITVPPIRVEARVHGTTQDPHRFVVKGYSAALANGCGDLDVRRAGTVRFGHGPERADAGRFVASNVTGQ